MGMGVGDHHTMSPPPATRSATQSVIWVSVGDDARRPARSTLTRPPSPTAQVALAKHVAGEPLSRVSECVIDGAAEKGPDVLRPAVDAGVGHQADPARVAAPGRAAPALLASASPVPRP